MKGYRKVLIAVNGNKEVLRKGLQLAGDERCWVTVVKVLPQNEGDLNLVGIKNIEDVMNNGQTQVVRSFREIAETEGALIKTRIEEGDVSRRIVEVAEEERCDVIVLGAQKRTWLRKIFGDNVVEKVIQGAPCPVLVI